MNVIQEELALLLACKTNEETSVLVAHLRELHKNDTVEVSMQNLSDIKVGVDSLNFEITLLELSEYGISLNYIAKKYLGKSGAYLSQRLHRNVVKGKIVRLTEEEITKISNGLVDTGSKLQKIGASLS